MEGGYADNSDGAHGSGKASQSSADNELSGNFDQATSNDTCQPYKKQKNHTDPLIWNKIVSEAVSLV